jgi:hypothetical protein
MIRIPLFLLLLICVAPLRAQTVIIDHETPATTTTFQYFGSNLEGSLNEVVANPNPGGINPSAMVGRFVKPSNSQTFAGAFSNPNPTTPISFVDATQICVDVHMENIGSLALKLELSTSGGNNWLQTRSNTVTGEWERLCFDVTTLSEEQPSTAAVGQMYSRVTLYFDWQESLPSERTYFFDNITTSTPVEMVGVTFQVDLSEVAGTFTTAYVSGTFNDFSGTANPLSDDDGDMIYSTTLMLPKGDNIEYLFQLDNFAAQERFAGTEDCVTMSPDSQFVNRQLMVNADTTLAPVCFDNCFDCTVNTNELADFGVAFNVYPTVAHDQLFIDLDQPTMESSELQLITTEGRILRTLPLEGPVSRTFNISNLSSGTYYIRLRHQNAVGIQAFIKH